MSDERQANDRPPDAPPQQQAESPSAAEAGADAQARCVETDLEELRGELTRANERVLRTQAELENYRKRVQRDLEQERRYANMPLIRDLLPVLDNIHRAIDAAGAAADPGPLLEGFRMVAAQLESVLDRYGCRRIEAAGQAFDPNLHEAVLQQPSAEHPSGTVVQELLAGYRLHDRVARPAQVIVSSGPAESSTPR